MSKDGKEGLMPCLFSRQGMSLDNIKFFRGDAPVISTEDFRKALCDAEERKRTKMLMPVSEPPKSGAEAIDVRSWLATM